jgi:hypothetical protein
MRLTNLKIEEKNWNIISNKFNLTKLGANHVGLPQIMGTTFANLMQQSLITTMVIFILILNLHTTMKLHMMMNNAILNMYTTTLMKMYNFE